MLPNLSEEDVKKAEEIIYSYIEKDYNSRGTLGSANGMKMPEDLSNAILYESTFHECTWGNGNWNSLSGNGCKFTFCDFFTNKIHNSALQHTLFDESVFYNCELNGSNFAYSTFNWTIMKNCPINGCAFTGVVFNHVTIRDSIIAHSNFELCKFQNTQFKNIDFSNLALKYTFFHNIQMDNVTLPFMQIPYTFGGMQYVFTTKDNIKIAITNEQSSSISVDEYKKKLPYLINFFAGHKEYFPLTNCYLANQQYELAEQANEAGVINSASLKDFRKLYFYCVQATQELNVTKTKRSKLYNKINKALMSVELNRAEYQEFRHYFPMIKELMFDNPHNNPTLLISLHTNINSDDFDNLSILMRILDELSEECGVKLDSKHIEIRHNSPNVVDWLPVGNIDQLLQLLQNTWGIVYPILSTALQESANAATVITGLYGLHKFWKKTKEKREKNTDATIEIERKLDHGCNHINQHLSNDFVEALQLRIDLLKQEKLWKENKSRNVSLSLQCSDNIINKFQEKIEKLKIAGIYIDTVEIQLFDEQGDALDYLYNSNIELE